MVRIDFPLDLTGTEFQDCLIRENLEDFITKVRVTGAQTHDRLKRYFNSAQGPDGPTKVRPHRIIPCVGLRSQEVEPLKTTKVAVCEAEGSGGRGRCLPWLGASDMLGLM